MANELEVRIKALGDGIAADMKGKTSFKTEVGNIVKNTDYGIVATKKIVHVTVFNPATGKLVTVQPTLVANRLSGNIKLSYAITNAEITIITI